MIAGALSGQARTIRGVLGSGLAIGLGMASVIPWEGFSLITCWFRELTGMSCLTCGLTRSLHAASHGHVIAAFQFHLLGPFVLAGMVAALVVCVAEVFTGKRLQLPLSAGAQRLALLGFVSIWIVYGVVRAIAEFPG